MLVGFWRAFRSDELARIEADRIQVEPGAGMDIFIPRTKGDRSGQGRHYKAPALKQLCPVAAYLDWVNAAQIEKGPVFRAVSRWGHLADTGLHPSSIIGIVKSCCQSAGIDHWATFTSHSLRRGFANWANGQSWDTKSLMEYVGWRDVQSAMRYIDAPDPFARLGVDHEPKKTQTPETSLNLSRRD